MPGFPEFSRLPPRKRREITLATRSAGFLSQLQCRDIAMGACSSPQLGRPAARLSGHGASPLLPCPALNQRSRNTTFFSMDWRLMRRRLAGKSGSG
jgi:hypothetical protein